jgi:lysophospholipase L1-like esterase
MPRALSRPLLILLGLALAGMLFEVAVRLVVPVSDFFWEWNPVVGVKLIPGKHGRSVAPGTFDVPVRINSHGYRDREHSYEKPPGTKRIVLLGDSFIEALQVPIEESLTKLLEDRLRGAGKNAELINLGVSGYGTALQYLTLAEYGTRYRPDLVVLFFVGNDVSDNSRRLKGLPYLPYPVPNGNGGVARDQAGRPLFTPFADQSSRLSFVTGILRRYSKAYRLVREKVETSPALHALLYRARLMSTPPEPVKVNADFGFYEIYRADYRPAWEEAWAVTEDLVLEIRRIAEAGGARFGLVIVPNAAEVYPGMWQSVVARVPGMREARLDVEKPSRRLSEFLTRHDVPHVALLPMFRSRAPELPFLYVPNDGHWSAAGHRLAAELLGEAVAEWMGGPGGERHAAARSPVPAKEGE